MYTTVGKSLFERRKFSKLNICVNVILVLLVVICIAEIVFDMRYTCIWVDGSSMLPTIIGEDEDLGNKGEYVFADRKGSPDYGDIVVVRRTQKRGGQEVTSFIIKRVVAFGGDTVKMENGVLYRKKAGEEEFSLVPEDYISEEYNHPENPRNSFSEHCVGENMIYLLGDNRDLSNDSRFNGDFALGAVLGVVPGWSLRHKTGITSFFGFFKKFFGFKINISDE